jgi:hypothetical protein
MRTAAQTLVQAADACVLPLLLLLVDQKCRHSAHGRSASNSFQRSSRYRRQFAHGSSGTFAQPPDPCTRHCSLP